MRKTLLILILFILSGAVVHGATGRAISLCVLQSTLKSGGSKQIERLCGITRLSGYVVDGKNRDIVLFGKVDPNFPPLNLDDFVVALRASWLLYAERKGNTNYYTPPGCSIDPDPKNLSDLRAIGTKYSGLDPDQRQQYIDEWRAVGARPQNVRVLGVPYDTRFAKVMVDADYFMKRLVDGSVKLDIDGFKSLTDTSLERAKKAIETGDAPPKREMSMNRFWFCPGESTYSEESGVVALKSCSVKLLTEHEFLTEKGAIAGTGQSEELAQQFADSFTSKYQEIASNKPIYKELEALFRFAAVANLLRDNDVPGEAGVDLRYLLLKRRVNHVYVDRTLPGLTNFAEFNKTSDTDRGSSTGYIWYLSCGGVCMDVHPTRIGGPKPAVTRPGGRTVWVLVPKGAAIRPGTARPGQPRPPAQIAQAPKTPSAALKARKSPKTLYWDFPTPD